MFEREKLTVESGTGSGNRANSVAKHSPVDVSLSWCLRMSVPLPAPSLINMFICRYSADLSLPKTWASHLFTVFPQFESV